MTSAIQNRKAPWNQSAFEKFKADWSDERRAEEEKCWKEIYTLAEHSPTLKEALDWAQAHDIKFFIDRTAVNCNGYYVTGTGVVALTEKNCRKSKLDIVRTLTHEIRHAWQDYNHFIADFPTLPGSTFAEYFIKLSLIEADASALGKRAFAEYEMALLKGNKKFRFDDCIGPKNKCLGKSFLSWFSSSISKAYGDSSSKKYGLITGNYNGCRPVFNFELAEAAPFPGAGIDITHLEEVLKLGQSFSGKGNYLADLPRDILPIKVLSPSLALTFYKFASKDQKKLTNRIHKYDLKRKIQTLDKLLQKHS